MANFDMNEVHLRDFKNYSLPYDQYLKQYFVGHYNPRGNCFFRYRSKIKLWNGSTSSRSPAKQRFDKRSTSKAISRIPNKGVATLEYSAFIERQI